MKDEKLINQDIPANSDSSVDVEKERTKKSMEKHEETVKELTGKTKKKKIFMVIFLLANILVIALTAVNEFGGNKVSASPAEVFAVWGQNWYYLLFALACLALVLVSETLKFSLFLKKTTGRFNLGLAWKCMIQGKYYDSITPSAVGGQPFQIYYLTKSGIEAGRSTSIAITCFFLTQFSFSVLSIISMISYGTVLVPEALLVTAYIGAVLATITPVLLIVASFIPKTSKKLCNFFIKLLVKIKILKNYEKARDNVFEYIDNYSNSIKHMNSMKGVLLINTLLSVIATVANASIPYFVILCCGERLPYVHVLTMCLITYSAISFIPTPGSSGAAEASFYLVFSILSGGFLFMGMLLWRFVSFYSIMLIGIVVVFAGYSKNGRQKVQYDIEHK